MLLVRLYKAGKYIVYFSWVLLLSASIITIETVLHYVKRIFDLPMEVILAINTLEESHEDKDETVQK